MEGIYQHRPDGQFWISDDGGRTWEDANYRHWRPEFAKAIDGNFYDLAYLDDLIAKGIARVHVGQKAAIVTEFKYFPKGKAAHVLVAAGDMDEITEALRPAVEAWAKANGCKFSLIESRSGWIRPLKRHGYSIFQTALVKEL